MFSSVPHANPLGVSLSDRSNIASNEIHATLYKRYEVSRDTSISLVKRNADNKGHEVKSLNYTPQDKIRSIIVN